jgi:hypothetical protein
MPARLLLWSYSLAKPTGGNRFTQHQFKQEGLAKSSIESRYKPVKRMLEKHLNIQAEAVDKRRAVSFADVCGDTLTPGTAKVRIMLLKSAWEWVRGRYQLPVGGDCGAV